MNKKEEIYQNIIAFLKQGQGLKRVTICSEIVNLLFSSFEDMNWVGFYEKDPIRNELFLSIYVGSEACEKINIDSGVCGKCYREQTTQIVSNVHEIPYHIACSSSTLSEIVVPVFENEKCVMILDIDSDNENVFDEIDQKYLEEIVKFIK